MILKTEKQISTFNAIVKTLGMEKTGPGSLFLAGFILSYEESELNALPVFQIGHAAGWNGRRFLDGMKSAPADTRTSFESAWGVSATADVAAFMYYYEKTFGRPIAGQI